MARDNNAEYMAILGALGAVIENNKTDLALAKYDIERLQAKLEEAHKALVLNSILKDKEKTAYDIITCTIPEYRRRGIARGIFEKVFALLRERGIETYTTETKRDNLIAQSMYRALGFDITNEIVTTLKTLNGSRQVEQYEVVMRL